MLERSVSNSTLRIPDSALALLLSLVSATCSVLAQEPRLPWEAPLRLSQPVLRRPAGASEILERFDIGPSQLESFFNGQPLAPSEEDVLVKLLYHLPRLGLDNLQRWREADVSWDRVAAAPAEFRAKTFRLIGRATRVEQRSLLPEQVERYEFKHYFLVTLSLENSPYQALVATRRVPAAWSIVSAIDERAAADALFLKVGEATAETPQLLFTAPSVGWYPDRPAADQHIGPSQLTLAMLGMDLSLWDDVKASPDHALTVADREAFYQLLAAVGRPEATQLRAVAAGTLNVVPLLEKPAQHFGEILPVQGVARRIMKVPVSDPDTRSRFGIDHYYEIDLFLPLAGANLRLGNDASSKKNPIYQNAFPATLIVRELPAGLAEGENVHELVRADAAFFKIWAYRADYTSQFGQLQPAPLFIAGRPQLITLQATTTWLTGSLVMAALVLALAVTGIIVWWFGRSDRAAAQIAKLRNQANSAPDFSSWK